MRGVDDRGERFSSSPVRSLSVVLILAGLTFWARLGLSAKESYWLDELFSVEQYVVSHTTLASALSDLALTSIHPPLYQTVLYQWIAIFGPSETSTRTLSNLFVTIAVVLTYFWLQHGLGRQFAIVASSVLGIGFAGTLFGLETRSYALTLLLSIASLAACERYLGWLVSQQGLGRLRPSLSAVNLVLINALLLLTHYYNVFFLSAQGIFALVWVATRRDGQRWANRFPAVVVVYVMPVFFFLLLWGRVALAQFSAYRPVYAEESIVATPLTMLRGLARQTFGPAANIGLSLALFIAVLVLVRMLTLRRREPRVSSSAAPATIMFAIWMAFVPVVVAYASFAVIGAERFSPRYLIYVVPPLIVSSVAAGYELLQRLDRLLARRGVSRTAGRLIQSGIPVLLVIGLGAVGGIKAAQQAKEDWRGTMASVVAVIDGQPEYDYLVLQTSFRQNAVGDFYLRRAAGSGAAAADGVVRLLDEQRGELDALEAMVAGHSKPGARLIVTFPHHAADRYPRTRQLLAASYDEVVAQLDGAGRGFIVYSAVTPAEDRGR